MMNVCPSLRTSSKSSTVSRKAAQAGLTITNALIDYGYRWIKGKERKGNEWRKRSGGDETYSHLQRSFPKQKSVMRTSSCYSSPADFVTFCEIFCGILPSTDFLSNGSGLRKNKQTLK